MKKFGSLLIMIFCLFLLFSCGGNSKTKNGDDSSTSNQYSDSSGYTNTMSYSSIDVDLSSMNGNIAYAQVWDMLYYPDKYEGKIFKIYGYFNAYESNKGDIYPSVIVQDATECCGQGIEFLLYGNPTYPTGYPKSYTPITIIGRFETYYEGNAKYCHIVDSVLYV